MSSTSGTLSNKRRRLERLIPDDIVRGVKSSEPAVQGECIANLRDFMGTNDSRSVQQVINSGLVPHLVAFLGCEDDADLQEDAISCLAEIACGLPDQVEVLVKAGAIPGLVHLVFTCPSDIARADVLYALGNICRLSSTARELTLQEGVMQPLLWQLNDSIDASSRNKSNESNVSTTTTWTRKNMLHMALWALLGLCHGGRDWDLGQVRVAFPTLKKLVIELEDKTVLVWSCLALSAIWSREAKGTVVQTGDICPRLVELLENPIADVQRNALRAIGALMDRDDDDYKQVFINSGILPNLLALLTSTSNQRVRNEACSVIGSLLTGNQNQLQMVIDSGIVPHLVSLLHSSETDIRYEACYALCQAMKRAGSDQITFLVSQLVLQGCIQAISDLLLVSELTMVRASLILFEFILRSGHENAIVLGHNEMAILVRQAQGFDRMKLLQSSQDDLIRSRSSFLLEIYLDEEVTPSVAAAA